MLRTARQFISSEDGAVTLDWVVLTGALVGTGVAVMSTVTQGVEDSAALTMQRALTVEQLRIENFGEGFSDDFCRGGVAEVQRREDARVDAGGEDPIDVRDWTNTYYREMPDEVLMEAHGRLLFKLAEPTADDEESGWTRDRTISSAVECEITARGLD